MFKVLVLQTLYTLSDKQTEYQLKDRWSFDEIGSTIRAILRDSATFRE
jgi:hypothetical protein